MTQFERLLKALIGYAYDTGYYSGKQGEEHVLALAIDDRTNAKTVLVQQVDTLVHAVLHAIPFIVGVDYYDLRAALKPFMEER